MHIRQFHIRNLSIFRFIAPVRCTTLALYVSGCQCHSDARRLYDDLLKESGYNKLIRPVHNNSEKLVVKLGLKLSQLIDVVSARDLLIVRISHAQMV